MFYKSCSEKFCNIHRKAPVLEFLFNKKRLQRRCFSVNITKFLRTPILNNICKRMLLWAGIIYLKETHNLFKKWPLNLWWISKKKKNHYGSWKYYYCYFQKAATSKSFLHLSYKNIQLLFFVTALFNIFMRKNINQWFLEVTQNYEMCVSFKKAALHFSITTC